MKKYTVKPYTVPSWIYKAVQKLRPVERIPVSQWAERHRVLPDNNAIPGMWRNSVTPYLVEIMDTFSDDMVEEIVFVKPTQVGGTASMENMLGSLISQDPAPTMIVYPSDTLAERVVESKLEPMIKKCRPLAEKYREHESKKLELRFTDMTVYLTGANSPADLASTNIRNLFLDEVDKFPGASKKEADPVSLARERTKTYRHNRKIFITSTPTLKTGHIWKAKEQADVEKHYFVPCPHCGEYIELVFAQIKWPSKEDVPESADRAEMAVYACQKCGGVITDQDKGKMLQAGRWQPVRQKTKHAKSVAFWMNTLYSPFTRFSEIAREFMKSKDDPDLFHNFVMLSSATEEVEQPAEVAPVVETTIKEPEYKQEVRERYGTKNREKANVILQAAKESWVKIEDGRGNTVISQVLVPGDVYYVPAGNNYKATFGNAGGIDVWVNGVLVPDVGPDNVRKTGISLAPDKLVAGQKE